MPPPNGRTRRSVGNDDANEEKACTATTIQKEKKTTSSSRKSKGSKSPVRPTTTTGITKERKEVTTTKKKKKEKTTELSSLLPPLPSEEEMTDNVKANILVVVEDDSNEEEEEEFYEDYDDDEQEVAALCNKKGDVIMIKKKMMGSKSEHDGLRTEQVGSTSSRRSLSPIMRKKGHDGLRTEQVGSTSRRSRSPMMRSPKKPAALTREGKSKSFDGCQPSTSISKSGKMKADPNKKKKKIRGGSSKRSKTQVVHFALEGPTIHELEEDGHTREWYTKESLGQLIDHEIQIALRVNHQNGIETHKSMHCCWRGLEHIQQKYDKGKHIQDHVNDIVSMQQSLTTTKKKVGPPPQQVVVDDKDEEETECDTTTKKEKQLSPQEELRRYSCQKTKEDRKKAYKLGKADEKFVLNCEEMEQKRKDTMMVVRKDHQHDHDDMMMSSKVSAVAMSMVSALNPLPVTTHAMSTTVLPQLAAATTETTAIATKLTRMSVAAVAAPIRGATHTIQSGTNAVTNTIQSGTNAVVDALSIRSYHHHPRQHHHQE